MSSKKILMFLMGCISDFGVEDALSKLENFGMSDAKLLRQIFIKVLSLRGNPKPQDRKELQNFMYAGFKGFSVNQGEYRTIYAVDEEQNHKGWPYPQ
ncbi:MAG TPA: hypothetical protein VN328_00410 [Thermodesulfovibrionales bacterium]|nr:hypothetical protein [Thermodesulfovibrionales bacterium]